MRRSPPVNGVIDADWSTLPTPADNPDVGGDDTTTCSSTLNIFTTGAAGSVSATASSRC